MSIFFSNCFQWLSFARQVAPLSSGAWPFLSKHFTR